MPVMTVPPVPGAGARPPGPRGSVVPMYAQLLDAVLYDESEEAVPTRSAGPLAELVRLRRVMDKHAGGGDPGWALQAVADQLAYDAALIRLARKRGVRADTGDFEVPEHGRTRLEQALVDKGVNLPARTPRATERSDPVADSR